MIYRECRILTPLKTVMIDEPVKRGMMNSIVFKTYSVKQLYKHLAEGYFAIPKLQRAFVWNGKKAAKLLDSVYRGMPIGSLTIWDTSHVNKNLLRQTTQILPLFNDYNKRVWFILDGQQRLAVLYQIFKGGEKQNGRHQFVNFDHVVFRVTEGEEVSRFNYRKPVPGEWVSLPQVLSPNFRNYLKGLSKGKLNRVIGCRERLQKYPVPLVRVESESLAEARDLFIRINSLGTPLGAADRAFAKAAKFDLRQLAEDTWAQLPSNFQGLRYELLLQTFALLEGIQDVGERAFEKITNHWNDEINADPEAVKQFTKLWDKQRQALEKAIDCLRQHFNVLDDGLLPSEYMLATLTVFFFHRGAQPTPAQLREIKKWFWSTGVGQRYSGRGFRENILKDAGFFQKLGSGKLMKFSFTDHVDEADLQRTIYGQRSSIADALYCLLISQKPASLSNGEQMLLEKFASSANRKHKHHIFPKSLLTKNGIPYKKANSIINICFISADENLSFGSGSPSYYLKPHRTKKYFGKVMTSHLIPASDNSGLWHEDIAKGYKEFIKARTAEICKAFENAAGIKLFRKE